MRILFLEDSPLFKYGLGLSMENKGIKVRYTQIYMDIAQGNFNSLIKEIKEFRPNIILNAGMCIMKNLNEFFNIIQRYNIPYVYWAIEDPVDTLKLSIHHARKSVLTLTTAEECIPFYKKNNINIKFMMFGCNKNFHRKGSYNKKFDHDIIFVGNNYSRHQIRRYGNKIMIEPLIKRGYDIRVYGNYWWFDEKQDFKLDENFYGGYCNYEELPDAYATAKIVLGLHSVGSSSTMMSMRTFEVLGCGGFYLSQYVASLQRYFTKDKDLTWSRNSAETLKLVDYYLKFPRKRYEIAKEGQRRCYKYHEYGKKVESLIKELKSINVWED